MSWHGGKGDKPRKGQDQKKYADNWDAIFGKKDKESAIKDKELDKKQFEDVKEEK